MLAGRYGAACDAHTHHPPFLPLRGVLWPSLTTPWSLHAGVESPTHEIRADADPSARSAKSIVITLANRHTFDRPVEILIHPSGTWALPLLGSRVGFAHTARGQTPTR